jgi:hypothetical protein
MKPLFSTARALTATLVVLSAFAARAQTITDARVEALGGVSWIGAVGDPVTVYGSSFAPNNVPAITAVKFNGTAAGFSVIGDTAISVTGIPVGATSGLISVTRSNVTTVFGPQVFQVVGPGPFVTSFTPAGGSGGTLVTMNGIRLGSIPGTNGILFNGKKATSATITSATQISAMAPPGVTTGPITVMASTGTPGTNNTPTNFYAATVITGFNPSAGRSGTNVAITGTNFIGVTSVLFNGLTASFTTNSNNQITATVPGGVTTGVITITAPGGGSVSASNFVVLPTITSFSPSVGAAGTNVVINGANLNVGTPVVKFNGATSTSVSGVTANQLTATVPSSATSGAITVTTTDGTATSLTLFYLAPRIVSFTPTNSAPGTTVTLNGTNFTDATSLKFNGTIASFSVSNNNVILATVPSGFTTGPLTLVGPGGTNSTAANAQSNFYAAPIITSFSPVHGFPGTNVTILGTNFLGTTLITFRGTPGTSLTVLSDNAARITVPNGASTGPIALTAPAGTATTVSNFFLDFPPTLSLDASTPPLVRLLWPPQFYTYALEQNNDLSLTSNWVGLNLGVFTLNGSNVVTTTNLDAQMYYRLKR